MLGDLSTVIFIIAHLGKCIIIHPLLHTGKGDLVGTDVDMHLRNNLETVVKSSCDVKALTYCDLKSIFIPGMMEVLKLYIEYQQEFANDIKHDLTYNLREGYDSEVSQSELWKRDPENDIVYPLRVNLERLWKIGIKNAVIKQFHESYIPC